MSKVEIKTFWENEKELAILEKNKSEKIKLIYGEKQKKSFIDIRILKKEKDGENYIPTYKGISIPIENAYIIADIIKKFQTNTINKEEHK